MEKFSENLDKKEAIRILMEAFKNDAVIQYLGIPKLLKGYILRKNYLQYLDSPYKNITSEGPKNGIEGILIYKKEDAVVNNEEEIKSINPIDFFLDKVTQGRYSKVQRFFEYMKQLERKEIPNEHMYIPYLGVDSSKMKRGIGTNLLGKLEEKANAHGIGIYLNTVDANNIEFYKKHGFSLVSQGIEPSTGIQYWTFKKEHIPTITLTQGKISKILAF